MAAQQLRTILPALLFLCAGVPLAALLDTLGFFDAIVARISGRNEQLHVGLLWSLAAVTTGVLNLDTTVVLLTPLYLRIARRAGVAGISLALIPLLLASFASSFLPISNLTTLIAAEQFDLSVLDVVSHLALPSVAACVVGWLLYRRRHPSTIHWPTTVTVDADGDGHGDGGRNDERALRVGGAIVAALLVGFVLGPSVGVEPWMAALAADVVLVVVTRSIPRRVPVLTAVGVAALAVLVAWAFPPELTSGLVSADAPLALTGVTLVATALADVVNNLPALLVALQGSDHMSWGMWAWLTGVNVGAVLTPVGALANLLWWRILSDEGEPISVGVYLRSVVPIALPAVLSAALVMGVQRLIIG